jgi:hypothetical protein
VLFLGSKSVRGGSLSAFLTRQEIIRALPFGATCSLYFFLQGQPVDRLTTVLCVLPFVLFSSMANDVCHKWISKISRSLHAENPFIAEASTRFCLVGPLLRRPSTLLFCSVAVSTILMKLLSHALFELTGSFLRWQPVNLSKFCWGTHTHECMQFNYYFLMATDGSVSCTDSSPPWVNEVQNYNSEAFFFHFLLHLDLLDFGDS